MIDEVVHMGEEKCCPCEAVKELQKKYEEIQQRLYEGNTHFQKLDMQFTHIEEGIANIQADLKKRNIKGNFSQIEKFPFYKNLFHYCYFYKLNI